MKLTHCPLCHSRRVRYVPSGDYQIHDGAGAVIVPDVEYNECLRCGEVFLSDSAMKRIQSFRESLKGPRGAKTGAL